MFLDDFMPLMDEAGDFGGGGGTAVADFDTGTSAGSADGGGGEVHDAQFVDESAGRTQVEESTALVKAGERAVQSGKITPSGRSAVEAVRALSPRLAQDVTSALLTTEWLRNEFPGGKREIQELRRLAQTSGGEQGLSELKGLLSEYDALDDMYLAHDPRFLEQITETDEGKQAFLALMPHALDRFRSMDPERFAHENSKNFSYLMDQARLPVAFARMADLLTRSADLAKAGNFEMATSLISGMVETYNQIANVLDGVYAAAKKQPDSPAARPQLNDRERQLSEREKSLTRQEWTGAVASERRKIFAKAWAEVTRGRNLTPDQDEAVKGFYEMRLSAKIRQWQNQGERFFANGDRDGYLREQFSFFQKAIPDSLRQAIQQALPAKPGPKGSAQQPRTAVPARAATANGAIKVQRMPDVSDLDMIRTTAAMVSANQAYRKDGKIVQWA